MLLPSYCSCRLSVAMLILVAIPSSSAHAIESKWVTTSVSGRLMQTPDAEGDRILDFSSVGYQGRGVEALPDNIASTITVAPVGGDDTASIQAAINAVSAMPIGADGYRGAVELTTGHFDINSQLTINASGVILRGAGREETGTVLHGRSAGAEGTNQRPLIRIFGSGNLLNSGSQRNLVDKIVPAGATSFRVDVPSTFQAGDTVRVIRATNDDWISDLGMDMIPPRSDGGTINQWTSTTINQRFDRVVTRVEGDRVFIDAPLPNAIEQHYGGGTIQKYSWSGAIENVGIESLRAESDFDSATDEDHAWEFISVGNSHVNGRAQDIWIRDIHGKYFGDSLVVANPGSKWVTVSDVIHEEPKSIVTGGRRYTYDLSGELGLVTNAQADEGRHDFANNSTSPKGPNVFHNSTATNTNSDSGPHQRYATGTLFDNITVEGDEINARNRSNLGSGHGWSGANMTIWNSNASAFRVQNPPTAQNWLVGSAGTLIEDTQFGPQPSGYYDSHGEAVTTGETTSLYEAQMNDARDISDFTWAGGVANWNEALGWQEAVTPGVYAVEKREYLQGDIDDYTDDGAGSVDDANIDAAWLSQIQSDSALPVSGFDDTSGNKNIAFTIDYQLDAGERVVHGSLALALKQSGGVIDTDFIRLFDFAPENKATFNDLGWAGSINSTDTFVGMVDLSQFLNKMQTGSVNVQLNDDSALDWALYSVTVAKQISGSESASVSISSGEAIIDSDVGSVASLTLGDGGSGAIQIGVDGSLSILDDFTQASGGILRITVSDLDSGNLTILGNANLDGTIELQMDASYTPEAGDSFTLLSVAGVTTGDFADVQLPMIGNGLRWQLEQGSGSVLASVGLAGDYNSDGTVNAADYTLWRDSLNSTTNLAADGNEDGVVNAADYLVWIDGYGQSIPTSAMSIPEPSAIFLLLYMQMVTGLVRPKELCRAA